MAMQHEHQMGGTAVMEHLRRESLEAGSTARQNSGGGDDAPDEGQKETHHLDDPEAHRRYMRKLNFIILPTISLLYFFEYLDRGNVAVSWLPVSIIPPP